MSAPPPLASRVASLADSIFGVAMTLLAYDITVPEGRGTRDLLSFLAPKVYALALSFSVSTMYWLNQQRRLGHYFRATNGGRTVVWEFLLLFAIVMMPITTRSFVVSGAATLYGANLAALAWLNLGLTALALYTARSPGEELQRRFLIMPTINAVFFLLVFVQSIFWPQVAHNLWFLAFTFPLLARLIPSLRPPLHDQT